MSNKAKTFFAILFILLVAGAALLTIYWKPVSNFFVNTWNSIFYPKQTEVVQPETPSPAPEDNVELTIKYEI